MPVYPQAARPDSAPPPERPGFVAGYGISDAITGLLEWEWLEERFRGARNYWICSTRPDGRPHAMPVWGVWLEGRLVFGTDRHSVKGRNLARDPRVAAHTESGDEVALIEGVAAPLEGDAAERADAAYREKYGLGLLDAGSPIILAVTPVKALAWLESDFPSTATRWRFGRPTDSR